MGRPQDIEKHPAYLGDGVYARFDGATLTLTTENGIEVQNIIHMDSYVVKALIHYMRKHAIAVEEMAGVV
jgi:hypothetical protein